MTKSSVPRPDPALDAPDLPILDEERPLLGKHSTKDFENGAQHATSEETATLSKSKIIWIMSSVWIGTFVAGLGEQHAFLSSSKVFPLGHS